MATVTEPIDMPAEALEPKPLFPDYPGKDVVAEIREWIKEQPTFTWRGHTHTKPDEHEAGELRYVADFQLAKGVEAPCPCCRPRHPKFGRGFIAWFPRSGCIRLIGQGCFRALDPDAHESAAAEFDERRRREATIVYLVANLPKRIEALRVIERAMPIAGHLDDLQDIFGAKLKQTKEIDLWSGVRADGILSTIEGVEMKHYGQIAGYTLLDPTRKKIVPELIAAEKAFKEIGDDDVEAMDDAERKVVARKFARGMRKGQDAISAILEARQFLSGNTIATLRGWGAEPNLMGPLFIKRDGLSILIGKSEETASPIRLDGSVDMPVPRMPEISV